jgi:hypothetical protein
MPAVIIRDTGEAIPVENLYLKQKHAEATGVPIPKFEECWICGSADHRRRDCPKGARRDDGSLIQATVVCLACRRRGHRLADCPSRGAGGLQPAAEAGGGGGGGAGGGAALCYRCGEAHHLRDCPAPSRGGALPFAHCFVCVRAFSPLSSSRATPSSSPPQRFLARPHTPQGRKGHLASGCPDNKNGVYPRGGSCKVCGSTAHLAADCPVEAAAGGRGGVGSGGGGGSAGSGGGGGSAGSGGARGAQFSRAPAPPSSTNTTGEPPAPSGNFQAGIFFSSGDDDTGAFEALPAKKTKKRR